MNPLAKELNEILSETIVYPLLSDLGRKFYFPKGIVSQSEEAKKGAHRFNATIGMAIKDGEPMCFEHVKRLIPEVAPADGFAYAPTPGTPTLREAWLNTMRDKNPSLIGKTTSLPMVTSGITHGIATVGDLFIQKGDRVVLPDMFWGNYRLILQERLGGELETFPFFTDDGGLNLKGIEESLRSQPKDKGILLLNFPNNPTGYSPSTEEVQAVVELLGGLAEEGRRLLVILDDSYFGLFYEENTYKESIFPLLCSLHENILAVKLDGATKEELSWGLRVGFITFGARGIEDRHYAALERKCAGLIRGSISNSNRLGQSLVLRGIMDPNYSQAKESARKVLKKRYEKVRELVDGFDRETPLEPLPFNSGYLMTFRVVGKDAEKLRLLLLEKYGVGTISIQSSYLRIAYSSVDLKDLDELFSIIVNAAKEL